MEKRRVLAVDDEPTNVLILVEILEGAGYTVETAKGGEEALRKIRDQPFDLVLLDWMMPQPDGFEVLAYIRANPLTADMLVIIQTARAMTTEVARANSVGANAVITKPFSEEELITLVHKIFGESLK